MLSNCFLEDLLDIVLSNGLTESEVLSLDASLCMDGITPINFRDLDIEVLF